MSQDRTKQEKTRVLARGNFVAIRKRVKHLSEKQKKHREWIETTCDNKKWWPREWTIRTGELRRTEIKDGATVISKIERAPDDITAEGRRQLNEIENLDSALSDILVKIAAKLHIPTECIDIKTGEITVMESTEMTAVNLDEDTKETYEEDASEPVE